MTLRLSLWVELIEAKCVCGIGRHCEYLEIKMRVNTC